MARVAGLQDQITAVFREAPFASHSVDGRGFYSDINKVELAWLGYGRNDLIGRKKPADFLTPESLIKLRKEILECGVHGFRNLQFELIGKHAGRRSITMSINNVVWHGETAAYRAISFDTEQFKLLVDWSRIAAQAFQPFAAVVVINSKGIIQDVNSDFMELSGYPIHELRGRGLNFMNSGFHPEAVYETILQSLSEKGTWRGELFQSRKGGEIYQVFAVFSEIKSDNNDVLYYVGSLLKLSHSKFATDQLASIANHDHLTGLPNRRFLKQHFPSFLSSAREKGIFNALLFIDLNSFKTINDSWGHSVGDMLLVEVAGRLTQSLRSGDMVVRFGGDEFIVVLKDLGIDLTGAAKHAKALAGKIIRLLAKPCEIEEHMHSCTPCIGIRVFDGSESPVELIADADLAMYHAKSGNKREGFVFFNHGMKELRATDKSLERDMPHAVTLNQLQFVLQPIYNLSRRIVGAEALLRWNHPTLGVLAPRAFIHLAEKTGLIGPIGKWVMQSACRQLKIWEADPRTAGLQLAINASAREFVLGDYVEMTRDAIVQAAINPALLVIELTESLIILPDQIRKTLKPLHDLGLKISLDDFGIGYSSLSIMSQLPLDQLKIDRSFVAKINNQKSANSIVSMINGMAKSLGFEVLAEGVETEAQFDFLQSEGCDLFQGYLFSPPVSRENFASLLPQDPS